LLGVSHAASFTDDVHVLVPGPARLASVQGVKVHTGTLDGTDIMEFGWCRLTSPERTAWDLAVWHDPLGAVPILDGMLRAKIVDKSGLDGIIRRRNGNRGCRQAVRALKMADGRAESPAESTLRVRLLAAGLPEPVPQCPVKTLG